MEDSVPATSSHQHTLALLIGRNTMKPTGEVWGLAEHRWGAS